MSTITERIQKLKTEFTELSSWEDRYKHLIARGKALPDLPESFKTEEYKVRGCQSQVWLVGTMDADRRLHFQADSDALLVKGLVSVLVEVYSGSTPSEVLTTPPKFIQELGFDTHLSPSRTNGLFSMLRRIIQYASDFETQK